MADTTPRPVVISAPDGQILGVVLQNEKGTKKSLERNELWAIHPETGRLLPVYRGTPVALADNGAWLRADLSEIPAGAPFEDTASRADDTASPTPDAHPPAARSDHGEAGNRDQTPRAGDGDSERVSADSLGSVLTSLAAVIQKRHDELPEGSYTTHLFTSGSEKIRKKMGEEAVELLLAREREHLVSETSDFLYHLLVLLEAEGVSLAEIAAELERR